MEVLKIKGKRDNQFHYFIAETNQVYTVINSKTTVKYCECFHSNQKEKLLMRNSSRTMAATMKIIRTKQRLLSITWSSSINSIIELKLAEDPTS